MPASDETKTAALDAASRVLLEHRARRYARLSDERRGSTLEVVTFRRGDVSYAIALSDLREIRPLRNLCPVPGASRVVPGVFHFRGQLMSAHDLAAFGGRAPAEARADWVLVVELGRRRLGLMADEVFGVLPIRADDRQPLPVGVAEGRACFAGLIGGDVFLIDSPSLFATDAFFRAS